MLTDVAIPEGVTTIGEDAFCGCTALFSVKIPESVTAIGSHAFGYNESYTKIAGFKVYCYKNSAGENTQTTTALSVNRLRLQRLTL